MQISGDQILQLINIFGPAIEGIIGAIRGSGANVTQTDDDLRALILEALAAKADADRAASGADPA